jgi:hypothetical protein
VGVSVDLWGSQRRDLEEVNMDTDTGFVGAITINIGRRRRTTGMRSGRRNQGEG